MVAASDSLMEGHEFKPRGYGIKAARG